VVWSGQEVSQLHDPGERLGRTYPGSFPFCALVSRLTGDIVGDSTERIDPRLGPLQDNGGSTETHAVLAGSPALGAGGPGCEARDQRHVLRSDPCDLGAYER
jgi:hypothetical protein